MPPGGSTQDSNLKFLLQWWLFCLLTKKLFIPFWSNTGCSRLKFVKDRLSKFCNFLISKKKSLVFGHFIPSDDLEENACCCQISHKIRQTKWFFAKSRFPIKFPNNFHMPPHHLNFAPQSNTNFGSNYCHQEKIFFWYQRTFLIFR